VRRREAGDAVRFTEGVKLYEDWECFGRLAGRGVGAFLEHETAIQYAHPGPRLTDAGLLDCAESRLVVLEHVWGSDPSFLAKYRNEYEDLVTRQHHDRIRGLLILGQTHRARQAIRELSEIPMSYSLLSQLPRGVVLQLLKIRRTLLGHDQQATPVGRT
jgi:hypothetical protein